MQGTGPPDSANKKGPAAVQHSTKASEIPMVGQASVTVGEAQFASQSSGGIGGHRESFARSLPFAMPAATAAGGGRARGEAASSRFRQKKGGASLLRRSRSAGGDFGLRNRANEGASANYTVLPARRNSGTGAMRGQTAGDGDAFASGSPEPHGYFGAGAIAGGGGGGPNGLLPPQTQTLDYSPMLPAHFLEMEDAVPALATHLSPGSYNAGARSGAALASGDMGAGYASVPAMAETGVGAFNQQRRPPGGADSGGHSPGGGSPADLSRQDSEVSDAEYRTLGAIRSAHALEATGKSKGPPPINALASVAAARGEAASPVGKGGAPGALGVEFTEVVAADGSTNYSMRSGNLTSII